MNNFRDIQNFYATFSSQKEIIEQLYLKGIILTYYEIYKIDQIWTLSENDIRDKFVYDFENLNPYFQCLVNNKVLHFTSENQIIKKDGRIYRTDIELFISSYGLFTIECKKIKSAEIRFVNDGISRFTDLKYSEKDESAGMIGFVCSGNISKIVNSLKPKVKAFYFVTDSEDLLDKKCVDWEFSFQSKHIRINKTEIHIYHLFFDFKSKRNKKIDLM